MRWSQALINTYKEVPADAQIVSHQLMLRAGLIKKLAAGVYILLPLGVRVVNRVIAIVREELNRAGAQELLMPVLCPAELWQGAAAGLGEDEPAREAAEQGHAKVGLQDADLLADRGRGHRELVRSLDEALVPGGGLERAQGPERRQAAGHGATARRRRNACSLALRVRDAARRNSARASSVRPSLASRSPRTLGNR